MYAAFRCFYGMADRYFVGLRLYVLANLYRLFIMHTTLQRLRFLLCVITKQKQPPRFVIMSDNLPFKNILIRLAVAVFKKMQFVLIT